LQSLAPGQATGRRQWHNHPQTVGSDLCAGQRLGAISAAGTDSNPSRDFSLRIEDGVRPKLTSTSLATPES